MQRDLEGFVIVDVVSKQILLPLEAAAPGRAIHIVELEWLLH